jgi:inorganic pyrophosphatase
MTRMILACLRGMSSLNTLSASPSPGLVHVVVESPRGSTNKLKYDPELQAFTLSRPLPLGLAYPHDWGFVPGTAAEDGDPVDALVLSEGTTYPGLVLVVRPIANLAVEQDSKSKRGPDGKPERERNDRLIAVPVVAPPAEWRSADDLPKRVREELEQFFVHVVAFEDKHVAILGWEPPEAALAMVFGKLQR